MALTQPTRPHPLAAQIIAKGQCPDHRRYRAKAPPTTDCKWCRMAWRLRQTEELLRVSGEAK